MTLSQSSFASEIFSVCHRKLRATANLRVHDEELHVLASSNGCIYTKNFSSFDIRVVYF